MSENFHEDIPDTPISDRDGENKSLPPDLSAAAQTRFEELTAEQQQAVLLRWRSEPEKNAKRFLAVLDRYEN